MINRTNDSLEAVFAYMDYWDGSPDRQPLVLASIWKTMFLHFHLGNSRSREFGGGFGPYGRKHCRNLLFFPPQDISCKDISAW
jgi:hypothetical protein